MDMLLFKLLSLQYAHLCLLSQKPLAAKSCHLLNPQHCRGHGVSRCLMARWDEILGEGAIIFCILQTLWAIRIYRWKSLVKPNSSEILLICNSKTVSWGLHKMNVWMTTCFQGYIRWRSSCAVRNVTALDTELVHLWRQEVVWVLLQGQKNTTPQAVRFSIHRQRQKKTYHFIVFNSKVWHYLYNHHVWDV